MELIDLNIFKESIKKPLQGLNVSMNTFNLKQATEN